MSEERNLQAAALERQGHDLLSQGKVEEAFDLFDRAGELYRELLDHRRASVCFASAGTCWNIRTGWQPLQKAATRHRQAADEAMKAGDFCYAGALYRDAAILFEKEGDLGAYSSCYVAAKRASRLYLREVALSGEDTAAGSRVELWKRGTAFFRYLMSSLSCAVWGHGERPFRSLGWGIFVIIAAALCYWFSGLVVTPLDVPTQDFFEALYFSVVTYTTVGYGDFFPTGWTRAVALGEAIAGITFTPLFLISLSRRYLRISR